MFNVFRNFSLELAKLAAFDRSFANIEFTSTGEILSANSIFCDLMGYSLAELKGARHSLFVEPEEARGAGYREFWQKLARGEFVSGEFKRIRKNGAVVYIRGVYNPILNPKGRVVRVVKIASDVTRERRAELESAAKLDAIGKMQAVVEFSPEGLILSINDGALAMVGYERQDVIGMPHSVLVDPQYAGSAEYREFWTRLRAGESVSGSFPRVAKGGKRLLVQASYNPIRDIDGTLVKIVKFANDLSDLSVLGDALAAVAQGDLSHRIESNFTPSFEKLKRDFNSTVDAIGGALGRIFGSINVVGDVTEQIASVSEMLAKRTEEQAANLEEAAAALDEVSATVNFTSANATRANEAVERAKSDAEKGDDVVSRAVEAMGRIENSSRQIASIIGVIDEIAFQTNLLALNAGVEAARAGDAGRGFAVVAAEVRALAQRSAGAAKQIKTLISASGADVASGVKLVSETGSSLKLIIEQVMEISSLVVEITKGAHEETAIVQEVNSAVNLVDEATQQNAAMAEETTAAVVSMQRQVEELLAAVGEFRLGGAAGEGGGHEADAYSYAA